jgi:ArsR family metal-binding transcriptional regulator
MNAIPRAELLGGVTLTCTLPCVANPGKLIVIGEPEASLGDVCRC